LRHPTHAADGPRPAAAIVCRVCLSDAAEVRRRLNPDGTPCHFVDDRTRGLICSRCVAWLAGEPLRRHAKGGAA
jgi:hypothetical protein